MTKGYTTDEFLDWLFWTWADTGQDSWPPEEFAWTCVEADMDYYEETFDDPNLTFKLFKVYSYEYGRACQNNLHANTLFRDAKSFGFNPVGRAERYVEENDLPELNWDWYEKV